MNDNLKESSVFGERLRELREIRGLTQVQLAEILHTSKQSIWNYEAKHREPSIQTLLEIANYFNVTVDYLVGNSEYKTPYEKELYSYGIFTKDTLNNISKRNVSHISILNALLCSDDFYNFLSLLYGYASIPVDILDSYRKILSGFPGNQNGIKLTRSEFKKMQFKPSIDEAVEKLLQYVEKYYESEV